MFEQASREKLRFQTHSGKATVEDLWDINLNHLNSLAKSLNKQIKEEEEEDFLEETSTSNAELKLRFDIVLHILNKKKEESRARDAALEKAHKKAKLLEILARKQDASLDSMSEEEIKAQIAAL